jgi:hypothetical protein
MSAKQNTKLVVRLIVGLGATRLTSQVINNNLAVPADVVDYTARPLALMVVGMMVAKQAGKFTDQRIDELFELFANRKTVKGLTIVV